MTLELNEIPAQCRADLYLGASIPGHPLARVNDAAFALWLAKVSGANNFPGYTVTRARGMWLGGQEDCRVLTIFAPATAAFSTEVRWIAERYKDAFGQESVLYSLTPCLWTTEIHPAGRKGDGTMLDHCGIAPSE